LNGEGDLLPGLVCDVYGDVAVLQFDGQGPSDFWQREPIAEWLLARAGVASVVEKARRGARSGESALRHLAGAPARGDVVVRESGASFRVDLENGQKTGFFLDQRPNRRFVREIAAGRSVLNLFSYTGGFSVSAGLGGASRVASVDASAGAIALASENWALNGLDPRRHSGVCADVFEFLRAGRESGGESWDHVIVDPPSMGHSEEDKPAAIAKYVALFAAAAKMARPGGELSLSSCSSHVSFVDFMALIEEALARARLRGQVVRVSGQGPDHPFPHACPELRYLKFAHLALA
jgi:23S rRNA (cytosine1962-C5)-methyltransferase